jgi:hypothetical protein
MCVLDSDLLPESLCCNLLVEAGLLLDFGQDTRNHKRWWTIFKDMTTMNGHPAMLIHEILQQGGPWSLSNCTWHVEEAKEVLVSRLETYVAEKRILPSFPSPFEVLFTFNPTTLVVNAATVTSWSAWESVAVRMKSPAV